MGFFDIFRIKEFKLKNEALTKETLDLKEKLKDLGYTEYSQTKAAIDKLNIEITKADIKYSELNERLKTLNAQFETKSKQLNTSINKIAKNKEVIKSIEYTIENFLHRPLEFTDCKLGVLDEKYLDELVPSVILNLNSMNVADLRKASKANNKQIESLLERYKGRYTTKSNQTIYALMVIALRAELQNILVAMKYEKLDKSIELVKNTTAKYLAIASEGNKNIVSTMTKFIGEIEYLFINAVKIEYNYYVKKEQSKQEQLSIKAQMRQEEEERKALEAEKKKVEREEEKYKTEMAKVNEQLTKSDDLAENELLKQRLLELEMQMSNIAVKKEEITTLQNGKAGTVYIISNLGSFGDDVFKVGMTRRLDPMGRVNELGSASVPFKFDVHSFIFSDDAVGLESSLHKTLNQHRMNKVNRRKEFFKYDLEELETLVLRLHPTAEFNKTMAAEDYRQSLSADNIYEDDYYVDDFDAEENE